MNSAAIMAHWKNKNWDSSPTEHTDWESMRQAMAKSYSTQRKWGCKLAMGFFAHRKI